MSRFSLGLLVALLSAGMPGVAQAAAPADGAGVIRATIHRMLPGDNSRIDIAVIQKNFGGTI